MGEHPLALARYWLAARPSVALSSAVRLVLACPGTHLSEGPRVQFCERISSIGICPSLPLRAGQRSKQRLQRHNVHLGQLYVQVLDWQACGCKQLVSSASAHVART